MPGDPERIRTAERLAEGVEISDAEWAAVLKVCREAGVDEALLH